MVAGRIGPIQSVVIDVNDMERAAAFWSRVLGAERVERPAPYLRLEAPDAGPHVLLQLVPEAKSGKARLHLDIAVGDLDSAMGEVEAIGGRRLNVMEENGSRFAVMADTEGNEFCLVSAFDE